MKTSKGLLLSSRLTRESRQGDMTDAFRLPDGAYDVLVVDATRHGETLAIEITIVSGDHKGEVVGVRATGYDADELELLGMPGTLHVENGVPRFVVEK